MGSGTSQRVKTGYGHYDRRCTALRSGYDAGGTTQQKRGAERATVTAARTALPTITALGMGMALPLPEQELQADLVDGKWQLRQAGHKANLSIAEQRRKWLETERKVAADALLTMADVQHGNVPSPQTKRNRLVVFDDLIDKLGHDEELEAMGSDQVMRRYLTAIEHLRDKGWLCVLIVTDHGFIHWPDSEERNVSPPVAGQLIAHGGRWLIQSISS